MMLGTAVSIQLTHSQQNATGGPLWAGTSLGLFALVIFARLTGLAKSPSPQSSPLQHPSSPRCIWIPCTIHAPAVMRRRCGSTRGYAQSDDLEPRARHSGAAARQAGGVATCVPQPQPHTLNSTHTHLASIARPRHLIRLPSNSARVSSICGTTHPQRIRAQRRPDPPQSHQNCLRQFQGSQGARGHFRLKQTMPPTRLSVLKLPLSRRTTPNVARHVARPKSKYIEIGRQRPIG